MSLMVTSHSGGWPPARTPGGPAGGAAAIVPAACRDRESVTANSVLSLARWRGRGFGTLASAPWAGPGPSAGPAVGPADSDDS